MIIKIFIYNLDIALMMLKIDGTILMNEQEHQLWEE